MARLAIALAVLLLGCSGSTSGTGGGGGSGGGSSGGGSGGGMSTGGGSGGGSGGGTSTGGGSGGGAGGGTGGGSSTGCSNGDLITALGKSTVMVGGSFDDTVDGMASWDIRYLYLAGGLFDGTTPCTSCKSSCTTNGNSCAAGSCAWWGCWQDTNQPPGQYVSNFVAAAKAKNELPMFTYYEALQASMVQEGTAAVTMLNDSVFLTRYFNDWRFVLQQIGNEKALLHIEPDLWGYGMQLNADPHAPAAAVTASNPTDCSTMENTFAGFGKCMVAMVRKYAPNAKVGLHASAWGTGVDVSLNTNASFDVVGEANKLADYLKACGAADADFVVVETSDRDAGYYQTVQGQNRWWDKTNATLPDFNQHFTWAKAVSERVGRPLLWWQMPVGNETLNNTPNHYQDNRLDYFFDHMSQVAQSHGIGVAYGAGAGDQTDPSTDNGHLVARVTSYRSAGGQAPCP